MIVLHEVYVNPGCLTEILLVEAFKEESPAITKDPGSIIRTSGMEVEIAFIQLFAPSIGVISIGHSHFWPVVAPVSQAVRR